MIWAKRPQLFASRPVKCHGIGGMRAHIVSPCHRAAYAYQPVQANLTRMQRMFDGAVLPRGRNPHSWLPVNAFTIMTTCIGAASV